MHKESRRRGSAHSVPDGDGVESSRTGIDWEILREGVLLHGSFKLIERIPRWVGRRRFRARSIDSDEERMILFFDLSEREREAWRRRCRVLASLGDEHLLPVIDLDYTAGYSYVVASWVEGPTLNDYLEENGPAAPQFAQKIVSDILLSLRRLSLGRLPLPPVHSGTILLEERGNRHNPILFPLAREGEEVAFEDDVAVSVQLRDLLFKMVTGVDAPGFFSSRALDLLPKPLDSLWAKLFNGAPGISLLEEVLALPVPVRTAVSLPAVRAGQGVSAAPPPPAPRERPSLPRSGRKGVGSRQVDKMTSAPARRMLINLEDRRRTSADVLAVLAAAFALGFVSWFTWKIAETLLEDVPVESSIPSGQPKMDADFGKAKEDSQGASTRLSPPPVAAETAPSPPPRQADSDKLPPPPSDPAQLSPRERVLLYGGQLASSPGDAVLEEHLAEALAGIEAKTDSLRAGYDPEVFKLLEELALLNSPSARLLLARVLWGRETNRSEQLFIRLAREGNQAARDFCDEQFIEWKQP